MSSKKRDVIIIGSGPAGYTAGLYTARASLNPLIIAGAEPGGQLTTTTEVENFPGFSKGIDGPKLMEEMRLQAEKFGAEIMYDTVTNVDFATPGSFTVSTVDKKFTAESIIICTGATARLLGLEAEKGLIGRGISTCATCDGYFFRGEEILIVGGGDTAMEEAIFLTRFASKVTVIHRRNALRASKVMQEKAHANEKIEFIWDTVISEIHGADENRVTGAQLKNVKSGEVTDIKAGGIFVAIGHQPNTSVFNGQIELDQQGYIITGDGTQTNIPGVFAAGDVVDHTYRQAITAAGMGCRAAIDVERHLEGIA